MALFVRLVRASWTEVESPPLALSLSPLSSSSWTKSLLWIQKPDGGLLQHTRTDTHTLFLSPSLGRWTGLFWLGCRAAAWLRLSQWAKIIADDSRVIVSAFPPLLFPESFSAVRDPNQNVALGWIHSLTHENTTVGSPVVCTVRSKPYRQNKERWFLKLPNPLWLIQAPKCCRQKNINWRKCAEKHLEWCVLVFYLVQTSYSLNKELKNFHTEYVCVIFSTLFTSLKQLKKRIMERTAV